MDNQPDNVQSMSIEVGTEGMINIIRLVILQKRLDHENVIIQFEDKEWKFDADGRTNSWPYGFCDTNTCILEALLGWNDALNNKENSNNPEEIKPITI